MPHVTRTLCCAGAARAACLVMAGGSTGLAFGAPPEFDGVPLRIVTLNLKDGIGSPGSSRYNDFGDYITVNDQDGAGPNHGMIPDVVMFQEVTQFNPGPANLVAFAVEHLPGYQAVSASGDGFNFNVTYVRPDIVILDTTNLNTAGPRNVVKMEVQVPGAAKPLVLYNAHFKAGGSGSDQNTRSQEADAMGDNVSFELNFGGPNFDGEVNVIFAGDLNSNNNSDGTLTGLFFTNTNPITPSGVLDLRIESLAGRTAGGIQDATFFGGFVSRLDYVCLDEELAAVFDTDAPFGSFSQDELNSMGYVYLSPDDLGQQANGNALATNFASDHRPVVFDVYLPRDPMIPAIAPEDVDADGDIDAEDLHQWESLFALTSPPQPSGAKDVNCNRNVEAADGVLVRDAARVNEITDMLTP